MNIYITATLKTHRTEKYLSVNTITKKRPTTAPYFTVEIPDRTRLGVATRTRAMGALNTLTKLRIVDHGITGRVVPAIK